MALLSFLDREHTVAKPGYSRWLVPPAALAVHLCIGQGYALSVFSLPLSTVLGITKSTPDDWPLTTTVWIFNIAFGMLGLSAALFGKWLERVGPRMAMFVSACCFSGGFLISSLGVFTHQIWLLYLGYGLFGGIGLGLGYISPVSTLIKWFPDRPGMATGMAIMGFGGGALIGSPLAIELMNQFRTPTSAGVGETFIAMGLIYFCFMMFGVFTVRVPAPNWKPEGFVPPAQPKKLVTTANVTADEAIKTPQFWLLWVVLCMNVTAGIGVLAQASPMIQEMFAKKLSPATAAAADAAGKTASDALAAAKADSLAAADLKVKSPADAAAIAAATSKAIASAKAAADAATASKNATESDKKSRAAVAGGFVALMSFFNLIGRFLWSSLSDVIGRKYTYMIYLGLGTVLYSLVPSSGQAGALAVFVILWAVIYTMYGGGFATIPAYLRDMFGTLQVGAIHGRLLTAWSVAAILGPTLVTYIRDYQINTLKYAPKDAYTTTMYIMAGLLVVGFIANLLVREVAQKHHHHAGEAATDSKPAMEAKPVTT
jgi:MFS family permease